MDKAKLFRNGKSQAVRLPKEYNLEGSEVYVKRLGRTVLLMPKDDPWEMLINSIGVFSEDFMSERAQPEIQERERL